MPYKVNVDVTESSLRVTDALGNTHNVLTNSGLYNLVANEYWADNINIDFSVVSDMNYYNGIIFRGFIDGIPTGVLSGGRYDNLLKKMGKNSGAIGFAVYLDLLERFGDNDEYFDVDVLLTYENGALPKDIIDAVKLLSSYGKSVKVQMKNDGGVKYRQLAAVRRGGFEILENND